ncbi:aspartyl protease family protein [Synechococcus sp. CS-1329]|uniref:retroviral-like aspartic protease family protein n=1 Tax=Synechococcus sp. CS-1329 TaxID=2847975 RepID=UPI00223C1DFA|nr:retroviral-like aspartic protease family protein [Synechococcus sp. CS-1329]MCT0217424.1 aspartyl protease family protein [Synechococcus sp. CS-1329]
MSGRAAAMGHPLGLGLGLAGLLLAGSAPSSGAEAITTAALIQLGGPPLAPGRSSGQVSAPLERASGGDTPVLSLQSSGGPVRLLLDTGASTTLVSPDLVRRLALESQLVDPKTFALAGAGEACPDLKPRRVRLPDLEISAAGNRLQIKGMEALVLPVAGLPEGVDGVLGAPQLRQQPLWIDPLGQRLSLGPLALVDAERFRRAAPATILPLLWREGVPLMPLRTPAGSALALADTGAEGLFITAGLATKLRPLAPASAVRLAGFCGEQSASLQTLSGLALPGGDPAQRVEAIVTANPIFESLRVEAIVGQELLRRRAQLWRLDALPATLSLWP